MRKRGKVVRRRSLRTLGYGMLDIVMAIAIAAVFISGFLVFYSSYKYSQENSQKRIQAEQLGYAIKRMAENIINLYSGKCVTGITNTAFGWGWRHPWCSQTIIFPQLSNQILIYTYDTGVLSANEVAYLQSEARSLFSFCRVDTSVSGRITITCPQFVGLYYCVATSGDCNVLTNLKSQVHTAGQSYDFVKDRIVSLVVEYDEYDRKGNVGIQHRVGKVNEWEKPVFVDFGDFYARRNELNLKKMIEIYNVIKKYEVTRRLVENQNTPPTSGLSEVDDYYVPWVYQVTASSVTNAFANCTSNCINLQNNSYWGRTVASNDMYVFISRIVQNLLNGDVQYLVDAYGNPLGVELLVDRTRCGASPRLYSPQDLTNPSNCIRVSNPPYPQPNYRLTTDGSGSIDCDRHPCIYPPYSGYVYSEFCYNLSDPLQNICRLPIVYVN